MRDISEVFQHLDVYDFLHMPVGYMPTCDNGIMAWRKGQAFDRLVEEWKEKMAKVGGIGDDQAPLGRIIDAVPDFKVGILSPIYEVKIMPAVATGLLVVEEHALARFQPLFSIKRPSHATGSLLFVLISVLSVHLWWWFGLSLCFLLSCPPALNSSCACWNASALSWSSREGPRTLGGE